MVRDERSYAKDNTNLTTSQFVEFVLFEFDGFIFMLQTLQGAVPDQELATLRGIVLFLCVAPYFIYKKKIPDVESHLRRWLPAYSVAIGGFSIFMFMAIKYVHLFLLSGDFNAVVDLGFPPVTFLTKCSWGILNFIRSIC